MYYILYCDASTVSCSPQVIEKKLSGFSSRYISAGENLWFYCAPKAKTIDARVSPAEYFVTHILREYITPDSKVFTAEFQQTGYYYELPEEVERFLSVDEPDE